MGEVRNVKDLGGGGICRGISERDLSKRAASSVIGVGFPDAGRGVQGS